MKVGKRVIIGMDLVRKMEYEGALHHYNKALKKIPDLGIALSNKAMILTKLGKHDEAIKCYEKFDIEEDARKRMPDGKIYHIDDDYDITTDRNHIAIMLETRIRVFEEAGMPEKVIDDCKMLQRLEPTSSTAKRVMTYFTLQIDTPTTRY